MHHTSLFHTPDIIVLCTRHHCIINQTSLYHTPDITVSYTRHHCIIHHTSPYYSLKDLLSFTGPKEIMFGFANCVSRSQREACNDTTWAHRQHCSSHTKYHGIIHQTPRCHTPNTTVSYTNSTVSTPKTIEPPRYHTTDITQQNSCVMIHTCVHHSPHMGVYDLPHMGVSYRSIVSYTRHGCIIPEHLIIHQTWVYHTPHHCIISDVWTRC